MFKIKNIKLIFENIILVTKLNIYEKNVIYFTHRFLYYTKDNPNDRIKNQTKGVDK